MKTWLLALSVFATVPAMAIDKSNQENLDFVSDYLFLKDAKIPAHFDQDGKSSTGEACHLNVAKTRYGVELYMTSGKTSVQFRVSVSGKTSQQFEVEDSDENIVVAKEVLLYADERDSTATREEIKLVTQESPGQDDLNNVASVSISNEATYDWTQESKPDFTKAEPKVTLSCSFEPSKK